MTLSTSRYKAITKYTLGGTSARHKAQENKEGFSEAKLRWYEGLNGAANKAKQHFT